MSFVFTRRCARVPLAAALMAVALAPTLGRAQHEHQPPAQADTAARADSMPVGMSGMSGMTGMMPGPLGIPITRMGSGTTWLPDASPMHAKHVMAGKWELMLHGVAFLQYDRQATRRGDEQFGSINWGMLMASREVARGRLQLRGMASIEPWTVTARGYPLLLQTGESYKGEPLRDRQHPHDLFMELAALYERPIARNLGVSLYIAPVGEPASGPVAYPHRPSAATDPLAPLGHHWQDATHIAFGVVTAGVFTRTTKLEGSIFNGREPDEHRANFDYRGRSLDSYAGRLTVNPSDRWSLSGSYAYLKSPEELHPDESSHRVTASILHGRPFGSRGEWSSALVYGANEHGGGSTLSNSFLLESELDLDGRNTVFGRAEYVEKSAEDLDLAGASDESAFDLSSLTLGYAREIGRFTGGTIGLGAVASVGFIPRELRSTYGTRAPAGFAVFVRFRPSRMHAGHGEEQAEMNGMRQIEVPRAPVARDTLPAARDRAPTHDDSMPGMEMAHDSVPPAHGSSAAQHDSTAMPTPADSAASPSEIQRAAGDSSVKATPSDSASPKKSSKKSRKPTKKTAAPRKKTPPPPHEHMPEMSMPADTGGKPAARMSRTPVGGRKGEEP